MGQGLIMNIPGLIRYLQQLADDFDLQQRHSESIYLREAAALVASHTSSELSRLTMTLGDQVFDMMTAKPETPKTTWQKLAEELGEHLGHALYDHEWKTREYAIVAFDQYERMVGK